MSTKKIKSSISSHIKISHPVDCKINKNGHLQVGSFSVVDLAKRYKTPLYIIDEKTVKYTANEYITSLKKYYNNFLILYGAKAFASRAIFKLINKLGLGLDVVSGGEIYLALKSGFNKKKIYFHGNNKTKAEIEMAIESGIGKIVCDNFLELELIQKTASKNNMYVEILLRLTPGIECNTHQYIKTGHLDSKFGFDLEYLDDVLRYIKTKGSNLILKGYHSHIGSQIFETKPFSDTTQILLDKFRYTLDKYNITLNELNIGGGIGISYTRDDDPITINEWAKVTSNAIKEKCKKLKLNPPRLICEPGRSIIGPSGITLYTIGSSKQIPKGKKYVSVDGGMADNPRPITYQANYSAVVANKMFSIPKETVTIAGRYCETGDLLIKDIKLPKVETGDIIAVFSTGAYNYSMSSNYNMVPRPACLLINGKKAEIIIKRETYKDLISKHRIPKWLNFS